MQFNGLFVHAKAGLLAYCYVKFSDYGSWFVSWFCFQEPELSASWPRNTYFIIKKTDQEKKLLHCLKKNWPEVVRSTSACAADEVGFYQVDLDNILYNLLLRKKALLLIGCSFQ